jgi:hypothetical protein
LSAWCQKQSSPSGFLPERSTIKPKLFSAVFDRFIGALPRVAFIRRIPVAEESPDG